jgi:hypothetical protein
MANFQFKNYIFSFNPNRFEISRQRMIKVFQSPIGQPKAYLQDLGMEPIVVSGEGELIGESLMDEYAKLYQLFLEEESGLLQVPGLIPFSCFFRSLSIVGQAGPKVLTYQFEFIEDCEKNTVSLTSVADRYVSRRGDTLALVAIRFGVSISQLLEKNPSLSLGMDLQEGTTIWI